MLEHHRIVIGWIQSGDSIGRLNRTLWRGSRANGITRYRCTGTRTIQETSHGANQTLNTAHALALKSADTWSLLMWSWCGKWKKTKQAHAACLAAENCVREAHAALVSWILDPNKSDASLLHDCMRVYRERSKGLK